MFRNGIAGKETVKGRFAALPAEVCRGKAVIDYWSSVISATGGPRFIFGAISNAQCPSFKKDRALDHGGSPSTPLSEEVGADRAGGERKGWDGCRPDLCVRRGR